jgi:hypothetical protein
MEVQLRKAMQMCRRMKFHTQQMNFKTTFLQASVEVEEVLVVVEEDEEEEEAPRKT